MVFLVKKESTDAGEEVETLVRSEAILAVVVAVVVAPAPEQSAREQKIVELKRIPVPIPAEDEVVARWERESTSEMPPPAASMVRAESAAGTAMSPQTRVVEAIGLVVPVRVKTPPWLAKIEPWVVRPPPK